MCRKDNFNSFIKKEFTGSDIDYKYNNEQFCIHYYYGPHCDSCFKLTNDISLAENMATDSQSSINYVLDLGNNKKLLPKTVFRYEL